MRNFTERNVRDNILAAEMRETLRLWWWIVALVRMLAEMSHLVGCVAFVI